jgi:hypothetical protein
VTIEKGVARRQRGAEIEGAVILGIAIKSFELHEAEAAEAWLAAG